MVAIGISSSASLNQAIAEAGFRAPLVSRAQDSRLLLDMIKQGAHGGMEKFTRWLVPFYTQGLSCSACTPSNKDSNHRLDTAEIALQYLQRTKYEWFSFENDRLAYFALQRQDEFTEIWFFNLQKV